VTTATLPAWHLRGTVVQACNCNWGCPCDFNAPPSKGYCEGTWTWHIEQGSFGDVALDGIRFGAVCKWPGQLHEGNGEAWPLLDSRATPEQVQAIGTLLGGQAGGPWAIVAATLAKVHEPTAVEWNVQLAANDTSISAGDALTMRLQSMRNPVTGSPHEASVMLPTGFIAKEMHKATTSAFSVRGPITYAYPGQDAAWGKFDYSGPTA